MGMIKLPDESIRFFKKNLDRIFESGALAEGEWNRKLSEFGKKYCDAASAVPAASNGSGMVALLGIYKEYFKRSRALIQSNTMYGVKTMVATGGYELAGYINCSLETLMPKLRDVESAIARYDDDKSSLVILLSHIGGIINPDMPQIAELCKQEGIVLLEDCAHSFGATLRGQHSGTFGDAGVYSFYATKAIPAGEGGLIVTNNKEVGALVEKYVIYDRFDQEMRIGTNIRTPEIQALLIYAVLKETGHIIDNKSEIAARYIEACTELDIPFIEQMTGSSQGNYYKFILLSPEQPVEDYLPALKTKTSAVYDYVLGNSCHITYLHCCLPIWYGQPLEVTEKAIGELYESVGHIQQLA